MPRTRTWLLVGLLIPLPNGSKSTYPANSIATARSGSPQARSRPRRHRTIPPLPQHVTLSIKSTPRAKAKGRNKSRKTEGKPRRNGRGGEIRTPDLLNPIQTRYQATLRPDQCRERRGGSLGSIPTTATVSLHRICGHARGAGQRGLTAAAAFGNAAADVSRRRSPVAAVRRRPT